MSIRNEQANDAGAWGTAANDRCATLVAVAAMMSYIQDEVTRVCPLAGVIMTTARLVLQGELDAEQRRRGHA